MTPQRPPSALIDWHLEINQAGITALCLRCPRCEGLMVGARAYDAQRGAHLSAVCVACDLSCPAVGLTNIEIVEPCPTCRRMPDALFVLPRTGRAPLVIDPPTRYEREESAWLLDCGHRVTELTLDANEPVSLHWRRVEPAGAP